MSAPGTTTNTTRLEDLPPWDGKESNYVTIFALIATSLAWMAVAGRLFARRKFTTFGPDDWLVIPAMVNNCSFPPPIPPRGYRYHTYIYSILGLGIGTKERELGLIFDMFSCW